MAPIKNFPNSMYTEIVPVHIKWVFFHIGEGVQNNPTPAPIK